MSRFRIIIFFCLIIVTGLSPAFAIEILAPAKDTVFKPGDVVTVRIGASVDEVIKEVLVATTTSDSIASPASGTIIFEAQVSIPINSVGAEYILLMATLEGGAKVFDYIRVQVDPGVLKELIVIAPAVLDRVGEVRQIYVGGVFEDGVIRNLTLPEHGTTYLSSNDTILGMHDSGLIQARSNGTASVSVTNRGLKTLKGIQVKIPEPITNKIPIADAGADQIVKPEQVVILSGVSSKDPDNDPLIYQWEQQAGRFVVLRDWNTAEPSFVSPLVDVETVLEFALVVIDDKGAKSFPDIVRIIVRP